MENNLNNTTAPAGKPAKPLQRLLRYWPDALAIVFFLLISFFYFQTPITGDMVLGGHDNDASVGLGYDQMNHREQTGEWGRWTNSVFSGMPTYQISPSYPSSQLLGSLSSLYALGTSGAFCYVFLYLLGFYILMRAFGFRSWLSALGAVVWAFSSYFFIIIAAGHIWKVMTLAFVPPTIAGMVLCYRGRYLWGGAVTALFTAFQIQSNHVQMTYYFLFVMLCLAAAYGIAALRRKPVPATGTDEAWGAVSPSRWLKATGVLVVAGLLGVMANLPNLYHTYEYSKESMRGKAELTPLPSPDGKAVKASPKDGLDYEYITHWSYGIDETLTLMIADFKGGGSGESLLETSAAEDNSAYLGMVQGLAMQLGGSVPGISCYWGEQPGTVGPVYVGAIVCFFFVLGLFLVRGPVKWGLLAATLISFLFAWGSNIPAVTHFLIDHLPMYNKFRTVSSALVMAEFTIPLLAMLALAQIVRHPQQLTEKRNTWAFYASFLLTAGVCFLFMVAPGAAGNCINGNEREFFNYLANFQSQLSVNLAEYQHTLTAVRHDILAASATRSFFLILLAAALVVLYVRRPFKGWILCGVLGVVCLADMWSENKRYLNDDSFRDRIYKQQLVEKTPADEYILADNDPDFRVYDMDGFSTNRTSYYHKAIGGYHAAKLRRYQDLIERHLTAEGDRFEQAAKEQAQLLQKATAEPASAPALAGQQLMDSVAVRLAADSLLQTPVVNMLNGKYFILNNGTVAVRNYAANGNAWFVRSLDFVQGADAEMAALGRLDTKTEAVADETFRAQLDGSPLGEGTARLTHFTPNELDFDVQTDKGGVLVFSEIYYPGWTATIDGQPAELGRANYVLRALKVPAGSHKVHLEFRPVSVTTTDTMAYIAIGLVLLAFLAAIVLGWRRK